MTEAEVILRFAMYFIVNDLTSETIEVSIDGAHVKIGDNVYFDIFGFMNEVGFKKLETQSKRWQGEYSLTGYNNIIRISSKPGMGDVIVRLSDGCKIYAECKKGGKNRGRQEYSLMREAIGQLMTGYNFDDRIIPVVAVPHTEKARELADRWSALKQIKNLGIKFALVKENGEVEFF